MVSKERQQSWSEYLDKGKENQLFVRFVFSEDYKSIEEFAVSYLTTVNEKAEEVVRFDCGRRETVNVHYFFNKPPKKRYLKREKSFETLEEFVKNIRANWMLYRSRFLDK